MTQIFQPPTELDLQAGEHPVVAFMTFSQYPAYGEAARDSNGRCSVGWSDQGEHSFKDLPERFFLVLFLKVRAVLGHGAILKLP